MTCLPLANIFIESTPCPTLSLVFVVGANVSLFAALCIVVNFFIWEVFKRYNHACHEYPFVPLLQASRDLLVDR